MKKVFKILGITTAAIAATSAAAIGVKSVLDSKRR